jgi:hypothetical protein
MPENTGASAQGTDIPTRCLACCRKALTIPAMRPIGRVENGADGALDSRISLWAGLCEGLEIRLADLDHEATRAGLAPRTMAPRAHRAGSGGRPAWSGRGRWPRDRRTVRSRLHRCLNPTMRSSPLCGVRFILPKSSPNRPIATRYALTVDPATRTGRDRANTTGLAAVWLVLRGA